MRRIVVREILFNLQSLSMEVWYLLAIFPNVSPCRMVWYFLPEEELLESEAEELLP